MLTQIQYSICLFRFKIKINSGLVLSVEIMSKPFLSKNNDLFEVRIKYYIIGNTAHRLALLLPVCQVNFEYSVEKTLRPLR